MSDAVLFRVMLKMRIRDGMTDEFERVWLEVGDSVTSHPANRGQWLARSVDEPDSYYITSDWSDEPSFRQFETSRRHVEHRQLLHPYRVGGEMTTMRVVAHVPHDNDGRTHEQWAAQG
ncbi:antibiotic biosynthesis monooxygenase [Dactylosporangium fulvum]|uniref:Antibiotic biosynthesis monooxygenase n=1 Tax=Dactylosporangium fulvum TaxID=53359 RepID=A0ABY5W9Y2_9ACTN|nr:antibiotic biosynthesis monooxygenase family protein [Dactylosporangium fulvum]UWP86106.1 antibiotic biosynthesis monooxygenase [Dactylosporangium fulvum]